MSERLDPKAFPFDVLQMVHVFLSDAATSGAMRLKVRRVPVLARLTQVALALKDEQWAEVDNQMAQLLAEVPKGQRGLSAFEDAVLQMTHAMLESASSSLLARTRTTAFGIDRMKKTVLLIGSGQWEHAQEEMHAFLVHAFGEEALAP